MRWDSETAGLRLDRGWPAVRSYRGEEEGEAKGEREAKADRQTEVPWRY
jgi:hypothetical protein